MIAPRRDAQGMKANPTRGSKARESFRFERTLLPSPGEYFKAQGLKPSGGGAWKNALCPFHSDTNPSLRVRLDTGAFRCMACGAKGGDLLAFHMKRFGMSFKQAAAELGAWRSL